MKFAKIFLTLMCLAVCIVIISGFAASKRYESEYKAIKEVDEMPSYISLKGLKKYNSKEVIDNTKEIVKERKIEKKKYLRPKGRWVWATVTAYEPSHVSCGEYADGKTSTGVNVYSSDPHKAYGYAVDPSIIPYGTKIYIPDYWNILKQNRNPRFRPTRPLICDDTGSAMRRSGRRGIIHIDVRFRTVKACREWGVRHLKVFIYD